LTVIQPLNDWIPLGLICQPQCASLPSVVVVNHKSNRHPYEEADPIHDGQTGHEQDASENRQDWGDGSSRSAKGALAIRFAVTENQDAAGNQSEREKSADVREV